MTVTYADEPPRTRQGAPRVHIDPQLVAWLEDTYNTGRALLIPLVQDHADAPALLRMMRIHATRRGLAVDHEWTDDDKLKFRMRDKRKYRHTPLPKETP